MIRLAELDEVLAMDITVHVIMPCFPGCTDPGFVEFNPAANVR